MNIASPITPIPEESWNKRNQERAAAPAQFPAQGGGKSANKQAEDKEICPLSDAERREFKGADGIAGEAVVWGERAEKREDRKEDDSAEAGCQKEISAVRIDRTPGSRPAGRVVEFGWFINALCPIVARSARPYCVGGAAYLPDFA